MSDTLTADSSAQYPTAQEPNAGSFVRRVIDTFISPVALFSRFGARPPWVDVMALSVVIGLIAFALVPTDVWVATMEEAMRQRGQELPPGADPASMAGIQRIGGMVAGAVFPWVILVIQAALMVLVFSLVLGGKATFRQYLGVVAHASLIGAVGQVVALAVTLQQGVMTQGITLAALAGGMEKDSFVYQFLNVFNVFLIWQLVVMGLGVATLNRRIGAGTAVGVLLGLLAGIAAAIAAIF
jgi:hypothetical protein